MAFSDIFLRSVIQPDTVALASPWSDNSHLETLTLADLGVAVDQFPATRTSAMQIATVAKGRNLICTSVARMPLIALRNGDPTTTPELLEQLEPGVANFITLSWTVDSMLFHGRAFWLITERNTDGTPMHIRYVPESKLETKDGILVRAFDRPVSPRDSIRIDSNSEGFLNYGSGVIREALEIEAAAREAGASPVPSVVLKAKEGSLDLAPEKIQSMLSQWSANRRKRGGSASYLNATTEIEALGQHAENLLIDARNVAALQVARALGLPEWAVSASIVGQSLSYSNQGSRNRELLDALTGYILSVEQTLSLFFPGLAVKFDTTELLRADTADRYAAYAVAIGSGVLTVNEARSIENLPPLSDEDRALNTPVHPIAPESNPQESA